MKKVYQLEMIIPRININSNGVIDVKYFSSLKKAKMFSEKNYGQFITTWKKCKGLITSGDLNWIKYNIIKFKVN